MQKDLSTTRYSLFKIMSLGWEEYLKHFKNIVIITLIVYLPINLLLSFITIEELLETHGNKGYKIYLRIIQLSETLFGVLATMAIAKLIESSYEGKAITWQEALKHALSRWRSVLWTGMLAGIILIGLYLLFIIPGIIWNMYYYFFVFVVALRGYSGKKALDYSKSLMQGQWWRASGIVFSLGILALILGIFVALSFQMLPDNQNVSIASDTVSDIISALFVSMTLIFFLNSDYYYQNQKKTVVIEHP